MTLQSCVLDNKESLDDIVRGIDKILEDDTTSILVRYTLKPPRPRAYDDLDFEEARSE